MRTFYMLRNTFFAVLTVLAAAASVQAATTLGAAGDGKSSVAYDSATGVFSIQPDSQPVGLFDIMSASGIFNATPATMPPGSLGFDVNSATRKSWAALSVSAINANHSLGAIAAPGLTQAFLLGDLTVTMSGGFGTNNRDGDLVYVGGAVGPDIQLVNLGEYLSTNAITQQLNAANGAGGTWSALTSSAGNPSQAASLSPAGVFTWNPLGSQRGPKGNGVVYSWRATVTTAGGTDTDVALTLSLIPEPATVSLIGLAMIGLVGLVRRR
jgi:hypothetical protein